MQQVMDKFLSISDSQSFSSGSETSGFAVDEQTFQNYMRQVPIWDYLKISRDRYLTISKEIKLAAIKDYVHAMKNSDNSLTGELLFIYSFICFIFTVKPGVHPDKKILYKSSRSVG